MMAMLTMMIVMVVMVVMVMVMVMVMAMAMATATATGMARERERVTCACPCKLDSTKEKRRIGSCEGDRDATMPSTVALHRRPEMDDSASSTGSIGSPPCCCIAKMTRVAPL